MKCNKKQASGVFPEHPVKTPLIFNAPQQAAVPHPGAGQAGGRSRRSAFHTHHRPKPAGSASMAKVMV